MTTNQAEKFFSQLKRSIDGTPHHVSKEHLSRYRDEFDYRHSTRELTDAERMRNGVERTAAKRLMYQDPQCEPRGN